MKYLKIKIFRVLVIGTSSLTLGMLALTPRVSHSQNSDAARQGYEDGQRAGAQAARDDAPPDETTQEGGGGCCGGQGGNSGNSGSGKSK